MRWPFTMPYRISSGDKITGVDKDPTTQKWLDIHRAKLLGVIALPVILFLIIWMTHLSSPQYVFKSFSSAIQIGDFDEAKNLCTQRFANKWSGGNGFSYHQEWQKEMQRARSIIWQRSDSTRATVTYKMSDGSYYRYRLVKTKPSWKVDEFEGITF
jgi:hypothetical protein